MFFVRLNCGNENEVVLFESWNDFENARLPRCYELDDILNLKISGKTYAERKASLEDIAIQYSYWCGEWNCSYMELAGVSDFFERNGKRYGLLTEFRENGIC